MSPLTKACCLILSLAALGGCGKSRNPVLFDEVTGHAKNWLADHGAAFSSKPDQCRQCHGDGLSGGASQVSCFSVTVDGQGCHPGGPGSSAHGAGWTSLHPSSYRANPNSCTCHGADLRGGSSGVSCFSGSYSGVPCHTGGPGSFTHEPGWIGSHQAAYRSDPDSCARCHGADRRGGTSGVSCYTGSWGGLSCHAGGPGTGGHPDGFLGVHAAEYRAHPSSCASCHGADLRGGTSRVSCYSSSRSGVSCHAGGPGTGAHPPGWFPTHPSAYRAAPASCTTCHGADLRGGTTGVSCYASSRGGVSCHPGGPGTGVHPPGWFPTHPSAYRAAPASCTTCHGADLRGGTSGVSCFATSRNGVACHPGGPGTAGHPPGFFATHASAYRAAPAGCTSCHGADLRGGTSGVSCYASSRNGVSCHPGGPGSVGHAPGFFATHPSAYRANPGSCTTCHGGDLRGGTSGVSCYASSRNGVSCHPGGPDFAGHPAGWLPSGHVSQALANVSRCGDCHGANLGGGSSGVACTACHMETWQRVHRLSWYPNVRGSHENYVEANGHGTCARQWCHGSNLGGVSGSGPSCSACHRYPD